MIIIVLKSMKMHGMGAMRGCWNRFYSGAVVVNGRGSVVSRWVMQAWI